MKKIRITSVFILFTTLIFAQNGIPYKIFSAKSKKISYKKMLKKIHKADIVLFGEHHNNSIIHWLQLAVTKDASKNRELTLGAEMLEADNQKPLNDYLAGKIDEKALDTLARLWKNFKTDYKPLVDFAKENAIKFIATNIPRRNAKIVFKKGFDGLNSLSDKEKSWIAPLPIAYDKNLPGYVKMLEMMSGHGGENLPKAQAIKDATMGYFIHKNLEKGKLFIHYNGSYHSDNYEAIGWYLKRYNPDLNIITISTVEQISISKLNKDHKNLADFIIVVPKDMTKTY
ncbi:MAG: ChaN family lipoprotein [Flavobacteriaceae bacterium]|nr:ChaN family lipoprotein [Flavobacteriaceae bacterium]